MYQKQLQERLTALRLNNDLSERKLSLDFGRNSNYFNDIAKGKFLPSMSEFFSICEFFDISPSYFFETNEKLSSVSKEQAKHLIESVDEEEMAVLLHVIKKFIKE